MHKRLRQLVNLGLAVLMVTSLGAGVGNVRIQARRIRSHRSIHRHWHRSHHYRSHRERHRRHRIRSRVNKRRRRHHVSNSDQVIAFSQPRFPVRHFKQVKRQVRPQRPRLQPNQQYLADNSRRQVYLFNDRGLAGLKNDTNYDYNELTGLQGQPVRVLQKANIDGEMFDRIYLPSLNHTAWVYSANLSNNPNYHSNFDVNNLANRLHSNYQILANQNSDYYKEQMFYQTLKDLNDDRNANGLPGLADDDQLNQLASLRSEQLINHFGHYDQNGNLYYERDAADENIPLGDSSGENVATASLGPVNMYGNPVLYDNHNGDDMANMDEDSMMNHDQSQGNGHRHNILDENFNSVGVGVSYDPNSHNYYLAEDFSS